MAIYQKKYTLEFDDIIEGEFNDYKLEINKKLLETTDNNVTVGATNNSGENINQFDPVRVVSGEVVRSKASVSSSMPSTGIATVAIASGGTTSNGILASGVLEGIPSQVIGYDYYVGVNGGTTNTAPTGTNIVQKIAIQVANNSAALLEDEVTLKGNGSPIQLNYNLVEDDILSCFRSSYLDVSFYKESLSEDFSELFIAENDSFKVFLYKNDNLFWQGWLATQLFSEPFASPPYVIKLRAYDGIHLLKDIPYFTSTDVFQATSNLFNDRYGYHNITDIIEKCIYNTGVLNDVFYYINIKNQETTNLTSEFQKKTRIHHQTFLNGESDSMNMREVLEIIFKSLGVTIYQRDGNWCIIRVSEFTTSNSNSVIKRSDWRAVDNPTDTNYVLTTESLESVISTKVSSEVDFFQVDNSSTLTLQYPLKEVIVEQEFDHNMVTNTTIDNVNDLGASDPSGLYLMDDWQPQGSNIQEAVVLRKNEPQSQSKNLNKSLLEADLGYDSVKIDHCDGSLHYPSDHDVIIDSSTITGLRAEAKARPLGRSLVGDQAIGLLFSPKLHEEGTLVYTGFGRSAIDEVSMINNTILRFNETAGLYDNLILGVLDVNVTGQSYVVKVYQDGAIFFTSPTMPARLFSDPTVEMGGGSGATGIPSNLEFRMNVGAIRDYTVQIVTTGGTIQDAQWKLRGYESNGVDIWGTLYYSMSNIVVNTFSINNYQYSDINGNAIAGGNIGTVAPNIDTKDIISTAFIKNFTCANDFVASSFISNRLNDWETYSVTATRNWQSNISNLNIELHLFGSAIVQDENGAKLTSPYLDVFDVSYTDIKLLPVVTDSKFVPKKQEYVMSQPSNFSNKKTLETKIGSALFQTGYNRYIGFDSTTSTTFEKSWTNWTDSKFTSVTMQHLLASCYMELYRIPVRRIDGTHYGNYKYGDRLVLKVNGLTDTLNGSQGKFYPMKVTMDLKMARTSFSGDDLLDNTGTDWQTGLTKTIKWIGENDITETETLT